MRTETQVSRDHVNMLVGTYPRDAPSSDRFLQNPDDMTDEELVAGFEAEIYHAATSVAAFPVDSGSEMQSSWWDNVLCQAPTVDFAMHLQGCPTHGNDYSASCLSCSIWQASEQVPHVNRCVERRLGQQ